MPTPVPQQAARRRGRHVPQSPHRNAWYLRRIIAAITLVGLLVPAQRVLAALSGPPAAPVSSGSGPGFTGEQELDPCLVNLRSRVYNRCQGRFLQPDSATGSGAVPGTLNRYSFAAGTNPVAPDPSSQPIANPIQASVQAMRSGGAGGAFVGGLCLINPVCWMSSKYIDNLPAQACETEDQRRARAMGNLIHYATTAGQAALMGGGTSRATPPVAPGTPPWSAFNGQAGAALTRAAQRYDPLGLGLKMQARVPVVVRPYQAAIDSGALTQFQKFGGVFQTYATKWPQQLYVATRNGEVVGAMTLRESNYAGYLQVGHLESIVEKTGAGTALMQHGYRVARATGKSWPVPLSLWKSSMSFYQKLRPSVAAGDQFWFNSLPGAPPPPPPPPLR